MPPLRPAEPIRDPALEAELDDIARRLRAELGAAAPATRTRPDPKPAAHAPAIARFFAALVLPGLLLLGVGLLFGTG